MSNEVRLKEIKDNIYMLNEKIISDGSSIAYYEMLLAEADDNDEYDVDELRNTIDELNEDKERCIDELNDLYVEQIALGGGYIYNIMDEHPELFEE